MEPTTLIRIAVDVDSQGDKGSSTTVIEGALTATKSGKISLTLCGNTEHIETVLKQFHVRNPESHGINLHPASFADRILMKDSVDLSSTRGREQSSMHQAVRLAATGQADAVVSRGNTAIFMAKSMFSLGRSHKKELDSLILPAFAPRPSPDQRRTVVLDVGANIHPSPKGMYLAALMGIECSKLFYGIQNPQVGLLSNGSEDTKGNQSSKLQHQFLKDWKLPGYQGYVEGNNIFFPTHPTFGMDYDMTDVVITDGFVGNITLKAVEGAFQLMGSDVKKLLSHWPIQLALTLYRKELVRFKKKYGTDDLGGSPFLGLRKGVAIKCHGKSESSDIKAGIEMAALCVRKELTEKICAIQIVQGV